jgi:hypothetical protein
VVLTLESGQASGVKGNIRVPIQRRPQAIPPHALDLPKTWLVDFEGVVADEVDRLAADDRLYQTLAATAFTGPGWDRFSDALARYGLQVLRAWIGTAKIFALCRDRGYPTERRIRLDEETVADLATGTVAAAIAAFRDSVLPKGRWDPTRGASLRTFFIGQCLMRFPREYGRWLKDNPPMQLVPELGDAAATDPDADPAHVAEVRALLSEVVAASPRAKALAKILALQTAGFSQDEIASRLTLSVGSVESALYRHRKRVGA